MKIMKMRRQPSWSAGKEPDRMTNIVGGFHDGFGEAYRIPVGYKMVDADKIDGVWHWVVPDKS